MVVQSAIYMNQEGERSCVSTMKFEWLEGDCTFCLKDCVVLVNLDKHEKRI
jgi:hypothetical protein